MINDEMKTDFLGGLFKESLDAYDAMIESADKIIEKAKCGNEEKTNGTDTE
jgi:hypothetical protein